MVDLRKEIAEAVQPTNLYMTGVLYFSDELSLMSGNLDTMPGGYID